MGLYVCTSILIPWYRDTARKTPWKSCQGYSCVIISDCRNGLKMPISILRYLACDFRRVCMSSTYLTFNATKRGKCALKSKYGHITRHDTKSDSKTVSGRREKIGEKIGERWTIPETTNQNRSSPAEFQIIAPISIFHGFSGLTVKGWKISLSALSAKFEKIRFLR